MEHNKQESMKISAVRLYENGFMTQPFAFSGEGMDGIDPEVKYRSSLQNFVIDTGSEVILVDTGMPSEVPDAVPDEKTVIYTWAARSVLMWTPSKRSDMSRSRSPRS